MCYPQQLLFSVASYRQLRKSANSTNILCDKSILCLNLRKSKFFRNFPKLTKKEFLSNI